MTEITQTETTEIINPTNQDDPTTQFIPISNINNHNFTNLFYDPNSSKFYKKCKKKVVIEVDDYKPIRWCKIQNTYTMKTGEVAKYEYKYINLMTEDKTVVRINEDDWAKRDKIDSDEKGVAYKI
jgi:hypothetical protein